MPGSFAYSLNFLFRLIYFILTTDYTSVQAIAINTVLWSFLKN